MISSIPRKSISFTILSLLIAMAILMHGASTAFASTAQTTITRTNLTNSAIAMPRWHRPWRRIPYGKQVNNQFFRACAKDRDNKFYWGRDQGNSGNNGFNRGFNEDNSSNAANQIVNRGIIVGHKRNTQLFRICSIHTDNLYYKGVYQGNSGNSGFNAGVNRDDSVNGGNQIIN